MWEYPPQQLILNNSEVHIWFLNIDEFRDNLENFTNVLSSDEWARSRRYKREIHQDNFVINRCILRLLLAKYININGIDISFNYNEKGKPFLAKNNHINIHFNLSHKNQYTVYGISKMNLGIDLEMIKQDIKVKEIAKRFFTNNEYNDLCKLNESQQFEYFFQLWTAKEAYLKAIGEGLSGGLENIDLSKKKNEQKWQINIINSSEVENTLWQIKTLNLPNNHLISWAVKYQGDLVVQYYKVENPF